MDSSFERPAFEYLLLPWGSGDDGTGVLSQLNELGAEGWEAVGLVPRAWDAPMGGMGADVVALVAVLLKRRRPAPGDRP